MPCSHTTSTGRSPAGSTAGADATRSTGRSHAPGMWPRCSYSSGVRTSSTSAASADTSASASAGFTLPGFGAGTMDSVQQRRVITGTPTPAHRHPAALAEPRAEIAAQSESVWLVQSLRLSVVHCALCLRALHLGLGALRLVHSLPSCATDARDNVS